MKRLRIWLKGLNLLQQFSAICFIVVIAFSVIFFSYISNNVDIFVNQQMYNYLHKAQNDYINSQSALIRYDDINVSHFVYNNTTNMYMFDINDIDEDLKSALEIINPRIDNDLKDGFHDFQDRSVVYSIQKFDNGAYSLVSIIRNSYRNELKAGLVDSVVNVTIVTVTFLFLIFMVWVVSLIAPLNQIRNYVDRVRLGEHPKLVINRRDEIGEVAEALLEMQEELDKQEHIREEMIQNISHDLKTPIATIKSYSESIKDGIYPYDTLEKSVDVIIEHADRLEKKVYSLITYNKMGYLMDNAPEGSTLAMVEIIQKAILACQVLRSDIKIETNLEEVYFHGEEEPWRIVVENLLDNAIRYAKTVVRITLKEDLLEVYNDGENMNKDRIEKLFKPYEKGNKGNFGLGLSIVKRVTETYGYIVLGENMDDGVVFRIISGGKKYHKVIEKTTGK